MLNGLLGFIGGFALAMMYFNLFLSNKAKRKADGYASTEVENEEV